MKKLSFPMKLLFWLILGMLSAVLAEVTVGSFPMPFFDLWGYVGVIPLYGLHILFFIGVIYNWGNINRGALYTAGMLFGMYEAYITKVLWNPEWGKLISFAGVGVLEITVLVLFWHAFMAFIIPLIVAELLMTNSGLVVGSFPRIAAALKDEDTRMPLLGSLAFFFGMLHSFSSPSPLHSLISGLGTASVLFIFIGLWRKLKGNRYALPMLLPGKSATIVFGSMMVSYYIFWGVMIKPENIPGAVANAIVLLLYAILIIWLSRLMKEEETKSVNVMLHIDELIKMVLIFSVTSAAVASFKFIGMLAILILWIGATIIGLYNLWLTLHSSEKLQ